MKVLTPAALLKNNRKRKNCLKGEGGYILFCVSEFCAMRVESAPSKDVYVFFILRRRVQRYCTAVRGAKNKKYMHRHHKIICVHNKIYLPETVHKLNDRFITYARFNHENILKIRLFAFDLTICKSVSEKNFSKYSMTIFSVS